MTPEEIEELFIRGAEIDRRLPDTARPARLKAQAMPYVHDFDDMLGWGTDRLIEERQAFWDARSTRMQTKDVAIWEECMNLIVLVSRERDRRCLWAWSRSKAGGMPFNRWCKDIEHIHRNYGNECRRRASTEITAHLLRNALIDIHNSENSALQDTPEIGDKSANIGETRTYSWMAPDAFTREMQPEAQDFTWANLQNERRRQRQARKAA
ncbi:hypothetical protein SJ05684_c10470 [Sinorhizobium sojae CCBAU 05684]|uniref:Uncharacterized protein n=1 Tax=Sinorhizobium sojae CCBAU 05684 TaxID=716928 RepID=A0A249P9Q0_9HYPH|nr:hypothetical protein SJ05684_c10470 [Sinorhizobium sojae CCBAU 05684]